MKLRVDKTIIEQWVKALRRAKSREIGGVLFGEHVGDSDFRIVAISHQKRGGDEVTFRRKAWSAKRSLDNFRKRHGTDHERFNYLGEWHSHPNASALPSLQDDQTMKALVADPNCDVNFLVLAIVRLGVPGRLELSAHSYLASGHVLQCEVITEGENLDRRTL